ncbi:nuclear transport factor 2 family protein [Phytoactinopolyspora halotolerans]|uniref:Nuclear transport factor 2 family protein n=1 Tax=Phytoactinopolyspora halotolerans TaxID=1981512 RepID=A0A6L9SFF7_9ACTN|nr:nuclear transport factor 2 family protein [Phytoactinopolyspora halotolerans]NEE03956.1 nuclear transport factor 2 family protein [Phytoactinopolyspora halotolerans]
MSIENNKSIVEKAIGELFGAGGVDAAAAYLHDDFVDHGPGVVTSNKADWIATVRQLPVADMKIEVHHVLAEGDHVTMLSRRWLPWESHWIAVVDIYRLEDGLIVEHGEVFQPLPETDRDPAAHSLVPW